MKTRPALCRRKTRYETREAAELAARDAPF